jgi:predicted metal-dependent HD superfamily phosphohydrolase
MGRQRLRWHSFWAAAGARGEEARFFADLDSRYSEPHRHYHDWRHVLACLDELDAARASCADPLAVELALWYHDAVHDPRAVDNEARSAGLVRQAAVGMGLGQQAAEAAAGLVLLTTHAGPAPAAGPESVAASAGDAALLLDIDLAVLGSSPGAFAAYESGIRAEYAFLSDAEYKQGRAGVLQSLLARPRIYLSDRYRDLLEARARLNLQQDLARLGDQSR